MAEINIRLIYNLDTGKKDIYIDFESDADSLPIEHEDAHRDIVENLIGQKVLAPDEAGEIVVRRVEPQRSGKQDGETNSGPEKQGVSQ
ncbi:MAG: hypothetical protein P1V20_21010 [Verrucomicrobiales bacterium]|nr:hypothetical protein [Verrucomicrobiales bacterium]